jgi:hypothetical protein
LLTFELIYYTLLANKDWKHNFLHIKRHCACFHYKICIEKLRNILAFH